MDCIRPSLCILTLLVSLLGLSTGEPAYAQQEPAPDPEEAGGFNVVRIENEVKLSVPRDLLDDVWSYLTEQYGNGNLWLKEVDEEFSTAFSDEYFYDEYFDSADMDMLKSQSGIRVRTRFIPDNPTHPKHGRELVQIKLNRGDADGLARSEIKFPTLEGDNDEFALLGLVGRVAPEHRSDFFGEVYELGLQPQQLAPVLALSQRRQRVYISLNGQSFATITLDEVKSRKWWKEITMVEVEMELNEINYTEASPEQRSFMEEVNEKMKRDLLTAFPQIVQDQTPKYNKFYNAFDEHFLFFQIALAMDLPAEVPLAGLPILLLTGAGSAVAKRRRETRSGSA